MVGCKQCGPIGREEGNYDAVEIGVSVTFITCSEQQEKVSLVQCAWRIESRLGVGVPSSLIAKPLLAG